MENYHSNDAPPAEETLVELVDDERVQYLAQPSTLDRELGSGSVDIGQLLYSKASQDFQALVVGISTLG